MVDIYNNFTPISCALILLFAYGKGGISNNLVCNQLLYVAKISPYAFLIHYVVFRYISFIMWHLPRFGGEQFASHYGGLVNITIGFGFTIFASNLWIIINKKIVN